MPNPLQATPQKNRWRALLCTTLGLSLLSLSAYADVLRLKADHPQSYVVKKGDTLWDISAHFLQSPWRWPELWGVNPQIVNPHLIYPGERLNLVYVNGQPRLLRKPHLVKSVEGRKQSKSEAIPAVNLSLISPYLIQNRVVDSQWLSQQPLVLAGDSEGRYHSQPQWVYAQGQLPVGQKVGIYQAERVFARHQTKEPLGQELVLTAVGQVTDVGTVSTIKLLSSYRETQAGNYVLAMDSSSFLPAQFMPQPASVIEPAKILASGIDVREMGKLDVAYIDRGIDDGVQTGDVFAITRDGQQVVINPQGKPVPEADRSRYDKFMAELAVAETYQLPKTYHGELMIFKVFDKTSLGLIMASDDPVRIADRLSPPQAQ